MSQRASISRENSLPGLSSPGKDAHRSAPYSPIPTQERFHAAPDQGVQSSDEGGRSSGKGTGQATTGASCASCRQHHQNGSSAAISEGNQPRAFESKSRMIKSAAALSKS